MNSERFSAIGHAGLSYWNPISSQLLSEWLGRLPLAASSRMLDVGCGRAEFLLQAVEHFKCKAIGVDQSALAMKVGQQQVNLRVAAQDVELRVEAFDAAAFSKHSFDLAVCIGSTHAISGFEESLRVLSTLAKPGGLILVGEGYWKQKPDPAYLDFLQCKFSDLHTDAGNQCLAEQHSLAVVASHQTSEKEWSDYEDTYWKNILQFVNSHPDDPDVVAMTERIQGWRRAYLKWGKQTLGFGLYLLQTPDSKK